MDIKKMALNAGVGFKDLGGGHVQLIGLFVVNYWPFSKNKKAYVSGTVKAVDKVSPSDAIKMCQQVPPLKKAKRKNKGTRKRRAALIAKGVVNCYWCRRGLTLESSTLEHIIPLGRGGLDNPNNTTLACYECNHERGCDMPELKGD